MPKRLQFSFTLILLVLFVIGSPIVIGQNKNANTITQDQLRIIQLEEEVKRLEKELGDNKAEFEKAFDKREAFLKELQEKQNELNQERYNRVILVSTIAFGIVSVIGFLLTYLGRQYINNSAKKKIEELADNAVQDITEKKVTELLSEEFAKNLILEKSEPTINELIEKQKESLNDTTEELLNSLKGKGDKSINDLKESFEKLMSGVRKDAESEIDKVKEAKKDYDKLVESLKEKDFSKSPNEQLDEETKKDLAAFGDALDEVKEEKDFTAEDWYLKGLAEKDEKKYKQAILSFSEAIQLDRNNAKYWFWRGHVKDDLNDFEGAIIDYNNSIKIDPENDAAWNNRGFVKYNLKDYVGAIADCHKAIQLNPKNAAAWNLRGGSKNALKDYSGAISDFNESIKTDPKYKFAWNSRGYVKNNIKDYRGAVEDFDQAIDLDKNYESPYAHRAYSYLMLRNLKQAIVDNQQALELDPEHIRACFYQGLIEEKQGNMDAACKAWEKAFELGSEEAKEMLDEKCTN